MDHAQAVVFYLVLQGPGPMDDIEVLMAAKARAILEDGCEIRSKLLQKMVCTLLFRLGYEYHESGARGEFYLAHPNHSGLPF